ncbi:hypothetical protein BHM03_00045830, partial [Ensete ventricosum]
MIGHCLGASGGLEAIATVKAITTGWLHPSINQFNPEPAVEFDTVANKKQQHEVNVGKFISFSLSHVGEFRFSLLFLTPFMQLSQIHSDLEGTTLWWYLHLSNHDLGSLFLPWAN